MMELCSKIGDDKYDKALVGRGSITLWIDAEVVSGWVEEPKVKTRGGQRIYSDEAVASVLMVRSVFHLPLRRAEGFCKTLFAIGAQFRGSWSTLFFSCRIFIY